MAYSYKPGTNKLDKVVDAVVDVATNLYDKYNDIKRKQPDGTLLGQEDNNYEYDEIGNLIADKSEGIDAIDWTVYGKIKSISKKDGSLIQYTYDASGNMYVMLQAM
jgi:YD repeat-containing protein